MKTDPKKNTMTEKWFNLESYGEEERLHHKMRRQDEEEMEEKKNIGVVKKTGVSVVRSEKKSELAASSKSLYVCSFETNKSLYFHKLWGAYVVRAIDLSDLLSSNDSLELRQVAYRAGEDLPAHGGCGVLGSQIVFASGLKPNFYGRTGPAYGFDSSTKAYAFDTNDPKHEMVDMDGTLNEGKHLPLTVEVAGKLYILSGNTFGYPYDSFEVFDPKLGSWSLLPEFPTGGNRFSYAIVGTKLFVSNEEMPVCCFDVADPNQHEWRGVPSMCQGGSFPFLGKALVLELEHHNNKRMLITHGQLPRTLVVYLMSLNENQETITPVHELKLPELPVPGDPRGGYHLFHLGGNNVCLVIPQIIKHRPGDFLKPGTHNLRGAAIPFQFEFDNEDGLTVQFLPPRILEYHTNPSSLPLVHTLGCFVL